MTITRAELDDLNDGDMVTVAGLQGLRVSGPVTVDKDGVWMGGNLPLAYARAEAMLPPWTQEFGSTLQIVKRAEPKPPPLPTKPAEIWFLGYEAGDKDASEHAWHAQVGNSTDHLKATRNPYVPGRAVQ